MTMMQDHPIDLIHQALDAAGPGPLSRRLGLFTALALILAFGLSALKPDAAAGAGVPVKSPLVSATASAHAGVTPLRLDGSVLAQTVALATSLSVCRLSIDPAAEAPLAATCAPPVENPRVENPPTENLPLVN
jgi:hypothetical protein